MARGGRKKADLKPVGGGNLTHDNTKNTLTDDELHALTLQHKRKYVAALDAKKKAAAALLNCTKLIKADLGDAGLADIKDMIAADEDGFEEKLQAELERKARLARWLGLDLGVQADLFSDGAPESQFDRGHADGKRAGLAGEVCKPPYGAGTDGYDGYMQGWHAGQAVLAGQIKKKEVEETPLLRPDGNEPAARDEFDAASDSGPEEQWPDDVQAGHATTA